MSRPQFTETGEVSSVLVPQWQHEQQVFYSEYAESFEFAGECRPDSFQQSGRSGEIVFVLLQPIYGDLQRKHCLCFNVASQRQ